MAKKSTLPADKRGEVVLRSLSKEEPAAQIARRAGISEQTLYRWREEFLNGGKQALRGRSADKEQDKELQQLKSVLAERDPSLPT
jgi:transposase-like protein